MSKEIVIIAPHADDELIGCYSVIKNAKHKPVIIYTEEISPERKKEVMKLKEHINVKGQIFLKSIPPTFLNKETTLYFPDPIYEIHPAHRTQGVIGEALARQGLNVIFYSTNMNAPYISEEKNPDEKKQILEKVYPSQSDLWKYDHKYFLFNGFCKWLF